jgi:hypothetical protein
MKTKSILTATLALALLVVGIVGCANEAQEQAKLAKQAKVSQAAAEQAALGKVPGGTVKEAELEKEDGKLVWSFDITTPGDKDITEVLVDANSGAVVSVEKESAEDEAKEKAEESKEQKGEHKD